jgi:hypothetical protein
VTAQHDAQGSLRSASCAVTAPAGLKSLQQTQSETLYTVFLTGLAEVLMTSAQVDEALVRADEALKRTEYSNALWWMPEAIRIKGEALLSCESDACQRKTISGGPWTRRTGKALCPGNCGRPRA